MKQLQNLFCLLIIFGCTISLSAQTSSLSEGCVPLEVSFTPPAGATGSNWDFDDGGTSTLSAPTHIYTSPGSYTVEFRNTSGGTVVGTVTINVYPKPELMFTASPQGGCRPLIVEFDASDIEIDPNVTINSYIWNYGDGSPSGSGLTPSHTFSGDLDAYDILLGITTDMPSCDVSEIFPAHIQISDPSQVSFTANPMGSCTAPATITFNNTSDPNLSYLWDFGDGGTSTMTNPSHTYPSEGIFTVTLTGTDAIGCESSAVQFIGIGEPTVDFTLPNTACVGQSFTITNNSVAGMNMWDFGNGQTSTATSPTVTYSTPGTYDVTLTVTTGNNCSTTVTQTIEAVTVDANFTDDPTFSCDPQLTTTFTPDFIDPNATYTWTFGDFTTSTDMMPTHTFNLASPDSFAVNGPNVFVNSLTVEIDGCTDTQIKFDTIHRPNARFMPDTISGCAPLTVEFSDSSFSTLQIVSWAYDMDDGNIVTDNTGDPINYTFDDAGEYEVRLIITNDLGCMDTSYAVTIEVGEPLEIDFSADQTSVCIGDTITFTPDNISADVDSWHFETDDGRSFHCPQDPEMAHAFITDTGLFDVSLVAEYNGCLGEQEIADFITVNGAVAKIDYEMNCETPFRVQFRNESIGAVSITWDFGDGTAPSSSPNPNHTYAMTGDYQVVLTAESPGSGCAATMDTVTICIRDLQAAFELDTLLCTGEEYMLDASMSQDVDARCWRGFTWDIPSQNRPITTMEESIPFIFSVPGDETVELAVMDINGCRDTATLDVRIFELRPLILADEDNICFPATVEFTDGSTGDTTIVSWEWDFGDGGMSTDQNPTNIYNSASSNPINVTLAITDTLGCDGMATYTIDVYTPFSSISPTPAAICVGESVTFAATDYTVQGSNLEFDWDFGDGQVGTSQTKIVTYTVPGTYNVTLDYQEVATGCTGPTLTRTIIVQDFPDAAFTTSVDTDPLICAPALIEFFDATTTSENISYSWNFDNGTSSSLQNPTNNFVKGTYDIELTVATIPAGCSDSVTRSFEVVGPDGNFTIDPNIICRDGEVTVNLVDTLNVISWNFNFGDGTSVDNQSPFTHQFSLDSGDTSADIVLTLVDQNGCEFVVINTVSIVSIVPDFVASGGGNTCLGAPMTFQNTSLNSDTYLWDFGDGTTSTDADPSHTYNSIGTFTVTLTATNTPFGCSETITQEVTISEDIDLNIPNIDICTDEQAEIIFNNVDPNGTYIWEPANLLINNTVPLPTTVELSDTTTFTVEFTTSDGCQGTGTVTVNVSPPAEPYNDSEVLLGVEGDVNFTLPNDPDGLNINVPWMDVDSNFVSVVSNSGQYTAQVTDNCGNTVNYAFTLVIISIPNIFTPNNDQLNDNFNVTANDLASDFVDVSQFKVYNRWGNLVYDNENPNRGWDGNFNDKPAPSDVYLYFIEVELPGELGTQFFRGDITLVR